nr:MAG TPA: hypothetical protein [Caudoviricetes sp.]
MIAPAVFSIFEKNLSRQRRAEKSAVNWQRIFPPRKGQSKIGLSQKTDLPNFGEMCPALD